MQLCTRVITPLLSKNCKDSTGPKTKSHKANQSYLYQISYLLVKPNSILFEVIARGPSAEFTLSAAEWAQSLSRVE